MGITTLQMRFLDAIQLQIRISLIRFLRKRQDRFYRNITHFQDLYEVYPEGSFRSLHVQLMYHGNKTLYWFCVANVWVEETK